MIDIFPKHDRNIVPTLLKSGVTGKSAGTHNIKNLGNWAVGAGGAARNAELNVLENQLFTGYFHRNAELNVWCWKIRYSLK